MRRLLISLMLLAAAGCEPIESKTFYTPFVESEDGKTWHVHMLVRDPEGMKTYRLARVDSPEAGFAEIQRLQSDMSRLRQDVTEKERKLAQARQALRGHLEQLITSPVVSYDRYVPMDVEPDSFLPTTQPSEEGMVPK